MFQEHIYTPEEVSQHLRVPVEAVHKEIAAGRLSALDVAGHLRIRESELDRYKSEAQARVPTAATIAQTIEEPSLQLSAVEDFRYKWPDGNEEVFTNAKEGTASNAGRTQHVKYGFTTRHAAGKARARCLVLVDRYATVEFAAATDAITRDSLLASVIKDRNGKQLPVGAPVPSEYEGLPVAPYRSVVAGTGASNGLAVVCPASDERTIIRHALIRYRYREERQ